MTHNIERARTIAALTNLGFGHRLRVTRIALGLTEEQAAAAGGRSVDTWRKYEATGKGRCTAALLQFCRQYDVSLDWLVCGDTARVGGHLAKQAQGTIVVLPIKGPSYRRAQRLAKERDMPEPA
jgi:transcriptional regulator with XRE-family HTH domain